MAYLIGKCLLSDRLHKVGMSQTELAIRLGVKRQQVSKWALGRQSMSMESAKNVASILGLEKMDDLYEWIPTRNRKQD